MVRASRYLLVIFVLFFISNYSLLPRDLGSMIRSCHLDENPSIFKAPSSEECTSIFNQFIAFHESDECSFSQRDFWMCERGQRGCDIDFGALKDISSVFMSYHCPYVQKACVSQKCKVCFIGDIHGCVELLVKIFTRMMEDGFLDANFHVIDPTMRIIFLGDYSDRGMWGIETLALLALFKLENYGNVFLLRGNHECYAMNCIRAGVESGTLEFELQQKFGKKEQTSQLFYKILQFYEYLPVGLFLMTEKACLQCCHGGIEPSYLVAQFLYDNNFVFDFIDSGIGSLGFLWNDFASGQKFHGVERFNVQRGVGYIYDVLATGKYLDNVNEVLTVFEAPFELKGIVRGHQGELSLTMLSIIDDPGPIDIGTTLQYWKKFVDGASFKIADHLPVYTLNTFNACHKYSYCVLDIDGEYENWTMTPVEG